MYKSIQGCRALAASLVVLHHLGGAVASSKYFGAAAFAVPFIFGDSGVEFFFVLSGFIITWVHLGEFGSPGRLLSYIRKRAVRIYPTYWLVFAGVYLAAQTSPTLRSIAPHDYHTLLESLALVPQDRLVVGGSGAPVLIVAWSLQYEICFYLLFGMFILSRPLGVLVSCGLLVNLGACHIGSCAFPRSFFANNLVLLFGIGAVIAYACRRLPRMQHPARLAFAAAAIYGGFGVFEAVAGTDRILPVDRRLIYGLLSAIIILTLVKAEDAGHLRLHARWMPLLGDSSYALYLIHFPLINMLCKIMMYMGLRGIFGASVAAPIMLAACLVAAVAFNVTVEKPLLRALSGKWLRPDAIPAVNKLKPKKA